MDSTNISHILQYSHRNTTIGVCLFARNLISFRRLSFPNAHMCDFLLSFCACSKLNISVSRDVCVYHSDILHLHSGESEHTIDSVVYFVSKRFFNSPWNYWWQFILVKFFHKLRQTALLFHYLCLFSSHFRFHLRLSCSV